MLQAPDLVALVVGSAVHFGGRDEFEAVREMYLKEEQQETKVKLLVRVLAHCPTG